MMGRLRRHDDRARAGDAFRDERSHTVVSSNDAFGRSDRRVPRCKTLAIGGILLAAKNGIECARAFAPANLAVWVAARSCVQGAHETRVANEDFVGDVRLPD